LTLKFPLKGGADTCTVDGKSTPMVAEVVVFTTVMLEAVRVETSLLNVM
jgi:hypothetical protein